MKDKKTKEQLANELTETRPRGDELETVEAGRKRTGGMIVGSRIWLPVACMFVLLCALAWLNEILDLPHFLMGAPRTPINWRESIIETVMIAIVALFAVSRLVRDVTEQARAEEALRESEERFRTVSDFAYDWEYWITPDGNFVYVSPSCERVTGYRADEFFQNPELLNTIIHPDDRAEFVNHRHEVLDTGEVLPIDFRIVTRSGENRWIAHICQPVYSSDGRCLGLRGSNRDISERKRAEESLRQRNRELALLNQIGQVLNSILDLDQVLATALEEVRRMLGVVACSLWLIDPETDELVCEQATGPQNEIVRGWRLAPGEGIAGWVVRNGESLIVPDAWADERYFKGVAQRTELALRSILTVPLWFKGNVIGVLQVVDMEVDRFQPADLTLVESLAANAAIAIKNAQLYQALQAHAGQLEQRVRERTAELETQYAQLDAILGSATDGLVVTGEEGSIIQANPVAQAWLAQTLSPEEAGRLRETIHSLAARAKEQPVEMLELTGLDLELSAARISPPSLSPPRKRGGRAAAVVAIHDVTHLKTMERIKTRFITNVSHELRTPITTIKLYAYLMRQQPEKWKQHLDALAQEADHQARLVEDILEISRIDAGRIEMDPRSTSINELAEAVVARHQVLAQERGLTLEHCPETGFFGKQGGQAPVSQVDPERMTQALSNLIENAIRYTPEGGSVVISTGTKEAGGRAWVTVKVVDTGMGIPEDELPRVFDRFFRGEEPRAMQLTGTGLGLAIVKEIVELHGGRVTVESQVDVGSTFTIWLPRNDGRSAGAT